MTRRHFSTPRSAKRKRRSVRAVCIDCDCTGVYQGLCEIKGEAVVCLDCDGSGCKVIYYTPFEKRRLRKGVKVVRRSKGRLIAFGAGGTGDAVSYREFLKGALQ